MRPRSARAGPARRSTGVRCAAALVGSHREKSATATRLGLVGLRPAPLVGARARQPASSTSRSSIAVLDTGARRSSMPTSTAFNRGRAGRARRAHLALMKAIDVRIKIAPPLDEWRLDADPGRPRRQLYDVASTGPALQAASSTRCSARTTRRRFKAPASWTTTSAPPAAPVLAACAASAAHTARPGSTAGALPALASTAVDARVLDGRPDRGSCLISALSRACADGSSRTKRALAVFAAPRSLVGSCRPRTRSCPPSRRHTPASGAKPHCP